LTQVQIRLKCRFVSQRFNEIRVLLENLEDSQNFKH
jgi:hypothetical protein